MTRRVLVVRPDSDGDVLLAGPAVRAVAMQADVVLWCSPRGEQAARLLPGVAELFVHDVPWIDPEPGSVDRSFVDTLVDQLAALRVDEAVILTSFHQSPLPTALVLRMAGIGRVAADSADYSGSLLDVQHRAQEEHEIERSLALVEAAGFTLPRPFGTADQLAVHEPLPDVTELVGTAPYVAVHPFATVEARTWPAYAAREAVVALDRAGERVVLTGSADDRPGGAEAAGHVATDLTGRTTYAELAAVFAGASVVVAVNSGPAHLAAAVGTPVVSIFAPTVPWERWRPSGVPVRRLGKQDAGCAGSRARRCPIQGHPCLSEIAADEVVTAVRTLQAATAPTA